MLYQNTKIATINKVIRSLPLFSKLFLIYVSKNQPDEIIGKKIRETQPGAIDA